MTKPSKKNRMLAGRGDGPHPYEIGADWLRRDFLVTENCARATQLKLEQQPAQARCAPEPALRDPVSC